MSRRGVFFGFVLAASACLVLTASVMAQQQQRGSPTPESRVAEVEKAVTLTADQKTQILKIYTDAAANTQGGGRGGFFGGATTEAVEKALKPEQVKKLREYNVQQSVDQMITRIDTAVTLTADQKTKLKPIFEKQITAQNEFRAKARAAGGTPDRDAMMAKWTELRDAANKALEPVLTKEQLEKYKAMPQRGGGRRQ